MIAVEHDHPRARSENGAAEAPHRLVETVQAREPHDRRRLAAGDHEAVEAFEILREPNLDDIGTQAAESALVLAKRTLKR